MIRPSRSPGSAAHEPTAIELADALVLPSVFLHETYDAVV